MDLETYVGLENQVGPNKHKKFRGNIRNKKF